ncbi:multidrug efflux SMR transporter [Nocardiopsis sp. NPDC006198]|uniref:Multidrug efflux SMR transporter n=1 Tax=Streptomonospora nanhaiensis TaxID=1323731 RepID=A0ABY6YPJ6_9ACTN|nr:multidrug efflux SMR transporter [Streptomonospora nanhaiensis]WAE74214.1 multidrug efflux SMR transporter [Streptomonospora nanhaiensis]
MAWVVLVISGLLETAWAAALHASQGFTRLWPTVAFGAALTLSMAGLAYALRTIPLGTGYAVWVSIGVVGTALVGMFFLGEGFSPLKGLCLVLIVAGVVGLKVLH